MELRHLRYFVAVAEELSFTRAAERLMMSQPPLSTQIKDLEEELGVELFSRTKRAVSLTPAGTELYARATQILNEVERASDRVRRTAQGMEGEIRLGFLTSTTGPILSAVMKEFRRNYPEVRIELWELTPAELVKELTADRLDLIVARPDPELDAAGMESRPFYQDPLVLTVQVDHPLSGRAPVELSELAGSRLVSLGDDRSGYFNSVLEEALRNHGHDFRDRLVVRSMTAMVWAISLGFGVGFLTEQTRDLSWKGVKYLSLADKSIEVETILAWNPATAPPTVANLLELADRRGQGEEAV